ncbi:uncharacterized protein B0P05DRAFT_528507 [Gilbertella persicaria]|uniref:uncharacterized protein n=1 Tax=Gilbertella persicaria TaxID=101096 RepID=UPI00222040A9|nr:uncharacterized protein B0P05DRAFT_528507 [Gilbertella persicaria]KAI8091043.1 hypothetical protein B0P05DRAFT_528507 [Gilbertella persicaria]
MNLSGEMLYVFFHQVMFLLTGLSTTLGTQWLFYHGAATGDSYLAQLAQYLGMVLVGLLVPILLKNKQKGYNKLAQEEPVDIHMVQINHDETPTKQNFEEGPIHHKSIMKLAVLDVFANFCVTLGFSIVGSGMYQVIYSSVVIWCAILTWFLMNRTLTKIQWFSIFGTSAGLAISSMGNFDTAQIDEAQTAAAALLMFGTIMTLGGTFFYSCVYVYSDYIMSQQKPPPLAARVCFSTGIYTSCISLVWIVVYTLPRFDQLIHLKQGTSVQSVWFMYILVSVSNACHSWNYYELIDRTGSVATGILQGLRAVLIYIISDSWYCESDPAQCKLSILLCFT